MQLWTTGTGGQGPRQAGRPAGRGPQELVIMVECVHAAWRKGVMGATGAEGLAWAGGLAKQLGRGGGLCCCTGDMPSGVMPKSSDSVEEQLLSSSSSSEGGAMAAAPTARHWLHARVSATCTARRWA